MPDIAGIVLVDDQGLHLPEKYQEPGVSFVVRVPTATIDAKSLPMKEGIFPLVDARHWEVDQEVEMRNPRAHPDLVGLKQYGAPIEWYRVVFGDSGD